MRQKRWIAFGSAVLVLVAGAVLGLGRSTTADEPVRVYLVHGANPPAVGGSRTSYSNGITVFRYGIDGNSWPTQVLGYLEDSDEQWVVLKQVAEARKGLEVWIPRERVQMIEFIDDESFERLKSR